MSVCRMDGFPCLPVFVDYGGCYLCGDVRSAGAFMWNAKL